MEILSPEDRVALWRSAVAAQGTQRRALVRALAREVLDALSDLDLYGDQYAELTVASLEILDDAGLFSSDSLRRTLGSLHEEDGGVDLLVAEISGLLRDAAGVERLSTDRRIQAVELAGQWREHLLQRPHRTPDYLSVGDVAARFGVTTQAVYKWLRHERIAGERSPGGSWRIPAAQFEQPVKPAVDRSKLDELQIRLMRLHAGADLPAENDLAAGMRDG